MQHINIIEIVLTDISKPGIILIKSNSLYKFDKSGVEKYTIWH